MVAVLTEACHRW